jgi:hypothetical protein
MGEEKNFFILRQQQISVGIALERQNFLIKFQVPTFP